MPWADYRCPECGHIERDHAYRMAVGAAASAPYCSAVMDEDSTCGVRMVVIPMAAFDLKTDGGGDRGFQKFEISRLVPTTEGPVQVTETIDSLHKLRQIEKDSEQRYRDGEGEPLRFRAYGQDRSNTDVGLFGREGTIGDRTYDSGKAPGGSDKIGVKRHGQKKPKVSVAKGAGASPLG